MANKVVRGVRQILKELDITWKFFAVIAGIAAIVGGMLLWKLIADRHYAQLGPGQLRGAHLVVLEDHRSVIVVSEDVTTPHGRYGDDSDQRLETIDAADGHRLARVQTDGHVECVPAQTGLIWCNTNYGSGEDLELRDAATLAVRVPHAKLVAGAPALATQKRPLIDARTGEAWMMTTDGRFWHVDPRTLKSNVEADEHELPRGTAIDIGPGGSPLNSSVTSGQPGGIHFVGSPRATMEISDGYGGTHLVGTETFLEPQFIFLQEGVAQAYPPPITLENGKVMIIVHHQTVDANTPLLVTAFGIDGVRRWTTTLPHGEIRAAWMIDHRIILGIHAEEQGAVTALDDRDGHVVWRAGT